MAQLKFFGYLADIVGKRTQEVHLEKPVALRELLPPVFPRENLVILIDERPGRLESVITDESNVVVMPVLSGG